jgi:hypothetical protein
MENQMKTLLEFLGLSLITVTIFLLFIGVANATPQVDEEICTYALGVYEMLIDFNNSESPDSAIENYNNLLNGYEQYQYLVEIKQNPTDGEILCVQGFSKNIEPRILGIINN